MPHQFLAKLGDVGNFLLSALDFIVEKPNFLIFFLECLVCYILFLQGLDDLRHHLLVRLVAARSRANLPNGVLVGHLIDTAVFVVEVLRIVLFLDVLKLLAGDEFLEHLLGFEVVFGQVRHAPQ